MAVNSNRIDLDFAAIMPLVARELLGDPNPQFSSEKEWRFGSRGSMSVDLDKGTFYDFGDETGGGVLDLVARVKGVEGAERIEWLKREGFISDGAARPDPKPERRIVATYDYLDETGALLFQVVRYDPKDFRQRRPNGNGGWIWNVKGVRLVPYRLTELMSPDIDEPVPVLIVEGEKDVDALLGFGFPATCNAMGAKKWTLEASQCLRGRDVILVPDNDKAGRDHMADVAGKLVGYANSIRVLDLKLSWSSMPDKADISDWLNADGLPSPERLIWLRGLIDQAPDWVDPANQAPGTPNGVPESGVNLSDFHAYMPLHTYIFAPTRDFWVGRSVNARVPPVPMIDEAGNPVLNEQGEQKFQIASDWLDKNRPVEQMTWAPGDPELIEGKIVNAGGWITRPDCRVFNLYMPPTITPRNAANAGKWIEHVYRVYPDEAEHIIKWLSHRVQRPDQKINHGIVMGGPMGIGKDTIIEPVKRAVGPWNVKEVSPQQIMGRFTGHLKSVILRVSEARDLGEVDRFKFYDHTKALMAAPPDTLRVDEKNLREHEVFNVCGMIITTNYKTNGIYLPADDRRHFVAWSDLTKEDFDEAYWNDLWGWFDTGGDRDVAAYLATLDISSFNPKAPPPKTPAFWAIVDASRAPEESELQDAIDKLSITRGGVVVPPDVVTLAQIVREVHNESFKDWLEDRKSRRMIPHRMEECGYVPVRNPGAKDGLWVIGGVRQVIYARKELSIREAIMAAQAFRW